MSPAPAITQSVPITIRPRNDQSRALNLIALVIENHPFEDSPFEQQLGMTFEQGFEAHGPEGESAVKRVRSSATR